MVINCNQINSYKKAYEKEDITLCSLCEASKGIRIRDPNNWYKEI